MEDLLDELAELQVPLMARPPVARFVMAQCAAAKAAGGGEVLGNLLRYLLDAADNQALRSRVIGLVWAFDLQHIAQVSSMSEHAEQYGLSKEAVSRASKRAYAAIMREWTTGGPEDGD